MPTTITIKNVPPELYEMLKQKAVDHRRSINNEVIAIIEDALRGKKFDPDDFLATTRRLRAKTKDFILTDDFINQAKNEGRP